MKTNKTNLNINDLKIGDPLLNGRYVIEDLIRDENGSICAYKAKNTTLNGSFILKFGRKEERDNFDKISDFLMKFKGDENVANTIARWSDGEQVKFVVQEYLTGEKLEDYFSRNNSVYSKIAELIDLGIVLSRLYTLMHRNKTLFEINKSHVLICDGKIKITDFGITEPNKNGFHYLLDLITTIFHKMYAINSLEGTDFMKTKEDLTSKMEIVGKKISLFLQSEQKDLNSFSDMAKTFDGISKELKILEQYPQHFNNYLQDMTTRNISGEINDKNIILEFNNFIEKLNKFKKEMHPTVVDLREKWVEILEKNIDNLNKNNDLNQVWPIEERIFYVTILLRSRLDVDSDNESFIRTHFGMYKGGTQYASSNWNKDYNLINAAPILINDSCAGLPIVWYDKQQKEKIDQDQEWIEVSVEEEIKFIRYILTHNVVEAKEKSELIKEKYKKGGWTLTTKNGEPEVLSDDVSSLITVPMYKSSLSDKAKNSMSIYGVAHFELIDSSINLKKLKEIAQTISGIVENYKIDTDEIQQFIENTSVVIKENPNPNAFESLAIASIDLIDPSKILPFRPRGNPKEEPNAL